MKGFRCFLYHGISLEIDLEEQVFITIRNDMATNMHIMIVRVNRSDIAIHQLLVYTYIRLYKTGPSGTIVSE